MFRLNTLNTYIKLLFRASTTDKIGLNRLISHLHRLKLKFLRKTPSDFQGQKLVWLGFMPYESL